MERAPDKRIPLCKPFLPKRSLAYLADTLESGAMGGDGPHGAWCEDFIRERIGAAMALLTNSASSALDIACALAGLAPGDEVVMSSFTFASTASAVVKTGATPVFVDIDPATLDLDVDACEAAITERTRAIIAVHYAGQSRDIEALAALADARSIRLIEDAAQAFDSRKSGRALGTFGALAAFSFQQSKNLAVGEGGALIVNDARLVERARHLRDKGTDRHEMQVGAKPFYSWVEIGAGCQMPEPLAALLRGQLEQADLITAQRGRLWRRYHRNLRAMKIPLSLRQTKIEEESGSNYHLFHVICDDASTRAPLMNYLSECGISSAFHFIPLHSSPAGARYGRTVGALPVTDSVSAGLLRLPLFVGLTEGDVDHICETIGDFFAT